MTPQNEVYDICHKRKLLNDKCIFEIIYVFCISLLKRNVENNKAAMGMKDHHCSFYLQCCTVVLKVGSIWDLLCLCKCMKIYLRFV